MTGATHETDALIVGGGPVGTALALDLTYRGVNFMIIEAGDGSVFHPKVSTIGPRSMEFFRRWSIADKIRNAGWPGSYPLDAAWVTKVGGHEVYRLNRGTADGRPLPTHTPEPDQICPAHWLTPLLMREVGIHSDGPLRTRCKLDGFVDHDDHVVATITNLADGCALTVQARFMVACDGASSPVRKACDIASPAQYETRVFRNILFRAPHLREQLGQRNVSLLCFAESDRREAFEYAFADCRVPLETTVCGDARIAELYEYPFVLVRPDGHVAWRGNDLPSDASWLVDKVRGAG